MTRMNYSIDGLQEIKQYPELPEGSESVALTMVLNYHGYDISKIEMARKYLLYSDSNFVEGYVGSPFYSSGEGIFPPGLVETANRFLKTNNSTLQAYNISGTEFEDLYTYIDAEIPVILWTTTYHLDPVIVGPEISHDGKVYCWYGREHCVVMSGYDKVKKSIQLYDPIQGVVHVCMERMMELYELTGKNAIVIQGEAHPKVAFA